MLMIKLTCPFLAYSIMVHSNMWSLLQGYAFGLNATSTDPLRLAGFSSKVLSFLSAGLLTFSPDWQTFSHQVAGVVPYMVEKFVDLAKMYHDPERWQLLSDAAYEQANNLVWDKVLQPFLNLF